MNRFCSVVLEKRYIGLFEPEMLKLLIWSFSSATTAEFEGPVSVRSDHVWPFRIGLGFWWCGVCLNDMFGHVRTVSVRHRDHHRLEGSPQSQPAWKPLPHHLSGRKIEQDKRVSSHMRRYVREKCSKIATAHVHMCLHALTRINSRSQVVNIVYNFFYCKMLSLV